jgi:hypothetical protein
VSSKLVASKLVDEDLIGYAGDEHSDQISIDDVRKLVALLGKAPDILT